LLYSSYLPLGVPNGPVIYFIKSVASKGSNKMALKWVPSLFEESDMKKAQKEGFLHAVAPIIFPGDERVPAERITGYVPCLPSLWPFSPCP
jgi:hypothetical protein